MPGTLRDTIVEALAIPLKQFVSQIHELALEKMSSSTQTRGTDIEKLAQDFARHCTEVQKQLQDLGAKVLPNAVACRASGKAHRVANALSTLCGWSWSADPRSTLPISAEWEGGWCRRCLMYADRLVGGASATHGVHEAPPVPSR